MAAAGRAVLRDYGGTGRPILLVPSLINPPGILDHADRSLLAWLAGREIGRVLMVDWGAPTRADAECDLAGHVLLLLGLMDELYEPPALVGYCLGGTLALAAAALRPASRLALLATPWRFGGYGDAARHRIASLWQASRPSATALGLLPMEVLQSGFWQLDPDRTIDKFARFSALDPHSSAAAAFVALEDWANDGPPLPLAAARELFEDFFAADLPGTGRWSIAGRTVTPATIPHPILNIVSSVDRIVPAASAPPVVEELPLDLGHVGMIVGSRARAELWEPLARFLSGDRALR